MSAISSNHSSFDIQVMDALRYLKDNHPEEYQEVIRKFPEKIQWGSGGTWIDTNAMGVEPDWTSWLADAIEETGHVYWEEGEPWTTT